MPEIVLNVPFKENPIYKVNYLTNANTITSITVFYGIKPKKINLKDEFKKNPKSEYFIDKNTGNPIFNDDELKQIKGKNIKVVFSDQEIHYDDTVGIVKFKIFK